MLKAYPQLKVILMSGKNVEGEDEDEDETFRLFSDDRCDVVSRIFLRLFDY